MSHHAHVYHTLEQLLEDISRSFDIESGLYIEFELSDQQKRYWTKIWKKHIEKNGHVPLIRKCSVCSGQELKEDIKHGRFKPARPDKVLRDEMKGDN